MFGWIKSVFTRKSTIKLKTSTVELNHKMLNGIKTVTLRIDGNICYNGSLEGYEFWINQPEHSSIKGRLDVLPTFTLNSWLE
jgi:hypothetical protein